MDIRARLHRVLREERDRVGSYLHLTLSESNPCCPVYGNPTDGWAVACIMNDMSFSRLCELFEGIRKGYPENAFVQGHYTPKRAAEDYLTLIGSIISTLDYYVYRHSPLTRADSRNIDWMREYFLPKYEEVKGLNLAWK